MLIVGGPTKIDQIFADVPHEHEPPWVVDASTLSGIDDHLWDWVLWLASKIDAGKDSLVEAELATMHDHLLAPMGVPPPTTSLRDAVEQYIAMCDKCAQRFRVVVDRRVENDVVPIVQAVCGGNHQAKRRRSASTRRSGTRRTGIRGCAVPGSYRRSLRADLRSQS